MAVQCVGEWSEDKHYFLNYYLAACSNPRRNFLPPKGVGAAFVDLFAGPGRARVGPTGDLVDGSPLIALKQSVPFSRVVLCELDSENVAALEQRTAACQGRVTVIRGDSNRTIEKAVKELPRAGLNVAWVDPYKLADLRFDTIAHLAGFQRMDLIVFFPVNEIRRFLDAKPRIYGPLITRALGTDEWRQVIRTGREAPQLISVFRKQLEGRFGYTGEQTYTTPIKSDNGTVLYHLVFASKHAKGNEIWDRTTRRSRTGQRRMIYS